MKKLIVCCLLLGAITIYAADAPPPPQQDIFLDGVSYAVYGKMEINLMIYTRGETGRREAKLEVYVKGQPPLPDEFNARVPLAFQMALAGVNLIFVGDLIIDGYERQGLPPFDRTFIRGRFTPITEMGRQRQ